MITTEMIYEGLGQVGPVENAANISVVKEASNGDLLQLFGQEASDQVVAEMIFNRCDVGRTGLIPISVLINFLMDMFGNEDKRGIFQLLMMVMDPNNEDPLMDIAAFQVALRSSIEKIVERNEENAEDIVNMDSSVSISPDHFDSENISSSPQISKSEVTNQTEMGELQFQHNKLQELHQQFQKQLAEMEEMNLSLSTDNSKLKLKINSMESELKEFGEEVRQLREDNGRILDESLQKNDDLQKMMTQYQLQQNELQTQIKEWEALQAAHHAEKEITHTLLLQIEDLEALVHMGQEELSKKDSEICGLMQELDSQQCAAEDACANSEIDRATFSGGNSLASELQCSLGTNMWKTIRPRSEFVPNPDWKTMISEPEFEGEPDFQQDRHLGEMIVPVLNNSAASSVDHCKKSSDGTVTTVVKYIHWIVFYIFFTVILMSAIGLGLFLLLSLSASPECNSAGGSLNYHCSPWAKLIEFIRPYCLVQYHGYPPV